MASGIRERRRAFWREAVQDWARSGLSKAAYAREHGLAAHQLGQWASRYPEWVSACEEVAVDEQVEAPATSASRFVTIAAAMSDDAVGESGSPIAVYLNSGHRVEVRPGFCSDTLQRVVAALSS